MASLSRQQLEQYLGTLSIDCDTVVDVGCAGRSVLPRLKSAKVNNYLGVDPDTSPIVTHNGTVYQLSSLVGKEVADYLFAIELMEYVIDPCHAIYEMYKVLKKGGHAVVSFHFAYPQHEDVNEDYMRYTKRGAIKLFEELFSEVGVVERRATAGSNALKAFYSDENMHMSERADHDVIGCVIHAIK